MIVRSSFSERKSLYFALDELKGELRNFLPDYDFLIFAVHPKFGYQDVPYFIKKVFRTNDWIAFHAVDGFSNEKVVDGISLLALKFEGRGDLDIFYIEDICKEEALKSAANYFNENREKLHLFFGGLCEHKLGYFIENLGKLLDYRPVNNIIGGISSGFNSNGEVLTYQFFGNLIIKNGFLVLSFSNVEFDIGISLGFKPYGIAYRIKKASGYRIYKVDDDRNFSYLVQNLMKGLTNDVRNLWYCPINILDENDGYVSTLRSFKEIGKDYVEFFGPVKEGEMFKFSFGDKYEILDEDRKTAQKVKKNVKYPDFLINYSCLARQYVLEDLNHVENEIYMEVLNAPLFGFFTYGEIGPDKFFKALKFYNQTSLLCAIREKT